MKRTRFAEYRDRYANYRFELSEDGVLLMQCHTNGGSLVWDWTAHDGMSDAFADVSGDREIKVLIHTGTGENYNANWGAPPDGPRPKPQYRALADEAGLYTLDEKAWYGRLLIENVLAVEVPMISVVNGPCNIHSEVPLLGDIVLASEDAYFQDAPHFARGIVPGDGQHVIWTFLAGHNRGRYFLLTGQTIDAETALEWGAVNEVHPKDQVVDRAFEIAHEIVKRPPIATNLTRRLFVQDMKKGVLNHLNHGIMTNLLAGRQFYPNAPGMDPMKDSWLSDKPFG